MCEHNNRDVIEFIKKTISDLQNVKEDFRLPFEIFIKLKKLQVPEQIRQYYDIKDSEIYDVITDFDKCPSELTINQKQLRKKYLGITLSLMNHNNDVIKMIISKNLESMSTRTPAQLRLNLVLQIVTHLFTKL